MAGLHQAFRKNMLVQIMGPGIKKCKDNKILSVFYLVYPNYFAVTVPHRAGCGFRTG